MILGISLWAGRCQGSDDQPGSGGEWLALFNGKDLAGWTPKFTGHALGVNHGETFRVKDGVLRVVYEGYSQFEGTFGHLFYQAPYSNYVLRLDYRFVGDQVPGGPGWALRNSGVMLHCQAPETMGLDQKFPVSLEAQLLGGDGTDERATGNLCTPGTHVVMQEKQITKHCIPSGSTTFHGTQWVTVELEVRGHGRIVHRINGETVLEYEQPQLDPTDADAKKLIVDGDLRLRGGYISLQAESHPVEFRNVEIRMLAE
jgi:hypothetical protein